MKPIPAIVEKFMVSARDIDLARERVILELAGEADDNRIAARHEQQAAAARESAKARRLRIGTQLAKVRPAWPERGPNAKGWGEFLRAVGISEDSALRYMAEARGDFPQKAAPAGNPAGSATTPDPVVLDGDRDVKPDPPQLALVPEPAPEVEIDRDTWCTPTWITDAIGVFDFDPCANERSHVRAIKSFVLERGENGLVLATDIDAEHHVFINPPYSDVMPWIRAYAHARFCFLLKLDPSTKWFAELFKHTTLILIPRGTRVQFEAPPGVPPDKAIANQFPHALFYAHAEDATDAIRALCFEWRIKH